MRSCACAAFMIEDDCTIVAFYYHTRLSLLAGFRICTIDADVAAREAAEGKRHMVLSVGGFDDEGVENILGRETHLDVPSLVGSSESSKNVRILAGRPTGDRRRVASD